MGDLAVGDELQLSKLLSAASASLAYGHRVGGHGPGDALAAARGRAVGLEPAALDTGSLSAHGFGATGANPAHQGKPGSER